MNISVKNPKTNGAFLVLELNKRETELLRSLIGVSSGANLAERINESRDLINKTNGSEVVDFLGTNAYYTIGGHLRNDFGPKITKVVEFVYDKQEYGTSPKWRTVHVTHETDNHIEGLEDGSDFKRFLKSRIVGGKVITVK